ncbi:MAG: hypothetical protein HQ553_07875 [Chloroflexi bacterium]|nr:hypothetical protein [Chloroflexota bacterium]
MLDKLKWQLQRARDVRRSEGTTSLLRKVFRFLTPRLYQSQTFYLYEGILHNTLDLLKDFTVDIPDIKMVSVSTNEEAEALEADGFDFYTTFATSDGRNLDYRQRLSVGAIAFCTYVGNVPASISWIVTSKQAQNSVSDLPIKMNFADGQAYFLDAWTHPEYRRGGLSTYNLLYNQFRYLIDNGRNIARSSVEDHNTGSIAFHEFGKFRKYAEGRYAKFLWWRFWKETPTTPS